MKNVVVGRISRVEIVYIELAFAYLNPKYFGWFIQASVTFYQIYTGFLTENIGNFLCKGTCCTKTVFFNFFEAK